MYRIVILSLVVVAVSAGDMDMNKCRHFVHPALMHCCKKNPDVIMDEDIKECFMEGRGPVSCARDLCIAKKKGFATADDKLDMEKIEENLTKEFEGQTDLIEAVKKNCINGDLNMFGPPEFCDFVKMRNCVTMQAVLQCPEWSDEGRCNGTKELVEECAKLYS